MLRFLSFLFLVPIFCCAQVGSSQPDTLLPVLVTAQRRPTPLWETGSQVFVRTQSEIMALVPRSTPEALMGVAGVFVQKTNHGGGSPFLRGLSGNQVLLLVDGIRLNNSTYRFGPNQYLNTVDRFTIDRIEGLLGSGSVQYGSDAMGGVVQVFSSPLEASSAPKWVTDLKWIGASRGIENSWRFQSRYTHQKWGIAMGYTQARFGDLPGGDTTGLQSPSGYQERNWDAKIFYQLSAKTDLVFYHQSVAHHAVPLYHRVRLESFRYFLFDPQKRDLSYLRWNSKMVNRWIENIQFTLSQQRTFEKRLFERNGATNNTTETDQVNIWGANVETRLSFHPQWKVTAGGDFFHDRVESSKTITSTATGNSRLQRGLYPPEAKQWVGSLFALVHWQSKRWLASGGLRWNQQRVQMMDTSLNQSSNRIQTQSAAWVGQFSLGYLLFPGWHSFIQMGSGFRSPNIDDMGSLGVVDFRYELPNYQLSPEKSWQMEWGLRWKKNWGWGTASVFNLHLTDLINRVALPGQVVGGYPVFIKVNNQAARIWGWHADGHFRLGKHWQIDLFANQQIGENETLQEPLRRVPPFFGRAALQYKTGHWVLLLQNLFAAQQNRLAKADLSDNRIPPGGTPGWNTWDIKSFYQNKKWNWALGCNNMLNKDYRLHGSGINGAGRHVYASIAYQWVVEKKEKK